MPPSKQKSIRISIGLYERSSKIAKEMGLSFQNYIRYLLAEDIRRVHDHSSITRKRQDKDAYFAQKYIDDIQKRELHELLNKYAMTLNYSE